MKFYLTRLYWSLITLIYMALITGYSIKPSLSSQKGGMSMQVLHNLGHVPVYAVMTYLIVRTLKSYGFKNRVLFYGFLSAAGFGVFNEILQSFVPGRDCSLLDIGLNMAGAAMAVYYFKKAAGKPWCHHG